MSSPYEELLLLNNPRWSPTFTSVPSALHCSIRINEFHPDLPKVNETYNTLISAYNYIRKANITYPTNNLLLWIHQDIFNIHEWSGKYRNINVRIGRHLPPLHEYVQSYMDRLEKISKDDFNAQYIVDWYNAFETIHPFRDGNGRTGAVIVAIFNKLWFSEDDWVAPNQ